MRMRVGLVTKLVMSALLVLVVMVAGLVAALQSTFETNLSSYLLKSETEQIKPLAALLGEKYAERGDWSFLHDYRDTWPRLIAQGLGGPDSEKRDQPFHDNGMMPRLTVEDANGQVVMNSPLPPLPEMIANIVRVPVLAHGEKVGTLRMVPTPIPVKGLNRQFRDDQLQAFYLAAIPALLITLLIALPLGYHFVRPLQRLTRGIHKLASGDYGTRMAESRGDELGQLASDFNHLATALEKAEEQRREGMASVSHELRTPLATMIASVEAMQDGIRPLNAGQLQQLSGTMDHLNTLVDDLYQLALADVGKLVCQRETLDWAEVLEKAISAMREKLEARGLMVDCALDKGIVIDGDPLRLRQIAINLLENCCRYTEADGTVWIRLQRENERAVLSVNDSGPGVSSEHLVSLFDRFTRVDASRSRAHGGAGLGLALVKAIAEAHEGTVEASLAREGGLGIMVSLPLA